MDDLFGIWFLGACCVLAFVFAPVIALIEHWEVTLGVLFSVFLLSAIMNIVRVLLLEKR